MSKPMASAKGSFKNQYAYRFDISFFTLNFQLCALNPVSSHNMFTTGHYET